MLYIMLGTIIFLLTFCAVGGITPDEEKNVAYTMSWIIGIVLIVVLGAVYYFFFR
jgi:hypothetical protein